MPEGGGVVETELHQNRRALLADEKAPLPASSISGFGLQNPRLRVRGFGFGAGCGLGVVYVIKLRKAWRRQRSQEKETLSSNGEVPESHPPQTSSFTTPFSSVSSTSGVETQKN